MVPAGGEKQTRGNGVLLGLVGLLVVSVCAAFAPAARAAATKTVRYRGYSVTVPAGWPVFHVGGHSSACLRFNRHAVYLGTPTPAQHCPATSLGRTEAILISPRRASSAAVTRDLAGAYAASAGETRLLRPGVTVMATWRHDPAVIKRALRVARLTVPPAPASYHAVRAGTAFSADAKAVAHVASTGAVYTGKGFDACSTPSTSQMSAWGSSPYRALGVYLGGANSACAQPNLNSTWMTTEWAAGWHVIPIYVGLQAPSNSCGCAAINPSQAASQGTAAAANAVADAQAVGIGPGNPIYNDMEYYSRTSTNSTAVMNFLAAWTNQLHADGYGSGVYGNSNSVMADFLARQGTSYPEPDDIWFANWNGVASTSDPSIPSTDWSDHQRLHQYSGAHNERYGGVTINIDSDYLDGATAFGSTATPAVAPSLSVNPTSTGTINLYASWAGMSGVSSWRTFGGTSPSSMAAIGSTAAGSGSTHIVERSAFPYYEIEAVNANGQVLGNSSTVGTRPHIALYGRGIFVPASGTAGVPAGCFTGTACQVSLTVHYGRRVLASTRPEHLVGSSGLLFVKLPASARRLLNHARGRRLPVTVTAVDISGRSAKASMVLAPYTTRGRGPGRSSGQSGELRFLGLRDFVYRGATGGVLSSCTGTAPCAVRMTITAGHQTVASTGTEHIGANNVSYLNYRLTPYGRSLLARARGNQLGALVTLTSGQGSARGHLSLSTYR